jgi:hypothetical protein
VGLLPYPSPTHPKEGDESTISDGNSNVPGGYTQRRRDIGRIGTGAFATSQSHNAIVGDGEGKSHV